VNALITRRKALGLLAASVATAAASPGTALGSWRRAGESAELDVWLAERLGQADVKGIAAAWQAAHPTETSAETLTRAIMSGRRRGESIGVYLSRVVAEEHRAGRAELLDGWFLVRTEARLAALANLSS
jgi:hypothetical protein